MLELVTKGAAVIVKVRVQAKASRDLIVGEHAGALKVSVAAPPDKGKANKAVVEVLAAALGIAKSSIGLVSGTTSREKTLAIRGEEFWPPVYEESGVQIGAYLVTYDNTEAKPSRDDLLFNPGGAAKIMPLSRQAIAKRMARR